MKKKIPVVPTVLLSAAALLLAGSTVGKHPGSPHLLQ